MKCGQPSRSADRIRDQESIDQCLKGLEDFGVLSPEEEQGLAKQLADHRERFQEQILSTPYGLLKAVQFWSTKLLEKEQNTTDVVHQSDEEEYEQDDEGREPKTSGGAALAWSELPETLRSLQSLVLNVSYLEACARGETIELAFASAEQCINSLPNLSPQSREEQSKRLRKGFKSLRSTDNSCADEMMKKAYTEAVQLLKAFPLKPLWYEECYQELKTQLEPKQSEMASPAGAVRSPGGESLESRLRNATKDRQVYLEAKNTFMKHNILFVISRAKKFKRRNMEMEDLIQEGVVALDTALEKFNYELGYKFSSYAIWWIDQGIRRALLYRDRLVRIPARVQQEIRNIRWCIKSFLQREAREPTSDEIALQAGLSPKNVAVALLHNQSVLSLSGSIDSSYVKDDQEDDLFSFEDNEAPSLGDLCLSKEEDLDEILDRKFMFEYLLGLMGTLEYRDREILMRRYGVNGRPQQTLNEVAQVFNVSRDRIRQLESRALENFRNHVRILGLG